MQSASSTVIDLQLACEHPGLPDENDFRDWADAALRAAGHFSGQPGGAVEITVRLVDAEESRTLNHDYREKDYATNVLSFPSELPDFLREQMEILALGDLVICVPVVQREAAEQGKTERDHWAHLTIHGVLHLLGFDHLEDEEAEAMEALETGVLAGLGIADPYADDADDADEGAKA